MSSKNTKNIVQHIIKFMHPYILWGTDQNLSWFFILLSYKQLSFEVYNLQGEKKISLFFNSMRCSATSLMFLWETFILDVLVTGYSAAVGSSFEDTMMVWMIW